MNATAASAAPIRPWTHPVLVTFVVTLLLRAALVLHVEASSVAAAFPLLDEAYYLRWAAEIAGGDLAGRQGLVGGAPWILNPLYAYVIAPLAAVFDDPRPAILALNVLLGAGTASMAAGAAVRHFGRGAGWVAGALTALAAPLAQLDAHVGVAELAAFLTAGACFAMSPAAATDRPAAHGPLVEGIWLGLGALARPVAVLAAPLAAWRCARGPSRNLRGAAVLLAAFAALAVPALARNRAVSGEWIVYTAAGGVNVHLGNNPDARAMRGMFTSKFGFHPTRMHEDARAVVRASREFAEKVSRESAREPTRGEVGAWFWGEAARDFVRRPAESAAFVLHKARWFFSPVEVPSSSSLALDCRLAPGLRVACVPTWLVAALAVAGLWAHRRDAQVLLGPGALLFAHCATTTLVFPLSHYRAPGIPAMAVLAAGAVLSWPRAAAGARAGLVAAAAAAALAGALPPQPDAMRMRDHHVLSATLQARGDLTGAEREAFAGLRAFEEEWGRDCGIAWERIADVQSQSGRWRDAVASLDRALAAEPDLESALLARASARDVLGDVAAAEADARRVLAKNPRSAWGHARLGLVLAQRPGHEREARESLNFAARQGVVFTDAADLRRRGLLE